MALGDLTKSAVLDAIAEYDAIGRDRFLGRYGFGEARSYFVKYNGTLYDSKALAGAAHKFLAPGGRPLRPDEFSGGQATVARVLGKLGFEIKVKGRSVS